MTATARNLALYPWYIFLRNLSFWQAIWFLFFQEQLSASEAILLYAVYDIATTAMEVPSGYLSDRFGRRLTLISSSIAGLLGVSLLASGSGFLAFALAQILLGCHAAFASGTDSALLYESLAAEERADEVEAAELRAWRYGFVALAISAVTGGAMALWFDRLPFIAAVISFVGVLAVSFAFAEPPREQASERTRLATLKHSLREPALIWLFVLAVLMYGFSHLPFVFGQPFIEQALEGRGLDGSAPLISGVVSAVMMVLSVAASLYAARLRAWLGLAMILLLAFGMQIALAGILALTSNVIAIGFLFLRMVPNALSQPFIAATIQPMLSDASRATYISLRSLCGRLLFAASLYAVSALASSAGEMEYPQIQMILGWYALVGLILLTALGLAALRVSLEHGNDNH